MLKSLYRRIFPAEMRDRIHPFVHPRMKFVEWQARKHTGGIVQAGPFKGMTVPNELGPHLLPLVCGTYELELHPAYQRLAGKRFGTVLDVGGGVGYYAVGAALWQTDANVVVWEADAPYHPLIKCLALANGVDGRVDVRGFCSIEDLQPFEADMASTLLIMDIEGYEAVLLDPEALPGLRKATIIVEFHDNMIDNCGTAIFNRFKSTHRHSRFEPRARTAGDYPVKWISRNPLLSRCAALAITERPTWREGRHGWFLLEPITSG